MDEPSHADVLTAALFRRFTINLGRYPSSFAHSVILHPPYMDTKVMSLTKHAQMLLASLIGTSRVLRYSPSLSFFLNLLFY